MMGAQASASPSAIDLFCGAGGATTGITQAGFDVLVGADHAADALHVCSLNHDHPLVELDLSTVDIDALGATEADYVHGSPPCKGFSPAGKRSTTDVRNSLVYAFLDWIAALEPRVFTMENVPAMRSMTDANGDNILTVIHERLDALGYDACDVLLEAADYGVPQTRKRLFVFGVREDVDIDPTSLVPPATAEEWVSVADALDGDVVGKYQTSQPSETLQLRGKRAIRRTDEPTYTIRGGTPSAIIEDDFEPGTAEYIGDVTARRLTETELSRLQSFPERYEWGEFTKTRTRQLIGNAVPPTLARAVSGRVRAELARVS